MRKPNVIKAISYAFLFLGLFNGFLLAQATGVYWILLWISLCWIIGILHGYENGKRHAIREMRANKKINEAREKLNSIIGEKAEIKGD